MFAELTILRVCPAVQCTTLRRYFWMIWRSESVRPKGCFKNGHLKRVWCAVCMTISWMNLKESWEVHLKLLIQEKIVTSAPRCQKSKVIAMFLASSQKAEASPIPSSRGTLQHPHLIWWPATTSNNRPVQIIDAHCLERWLGRTANPANLTPLQTEASFLMRC
jgi:hypothetical protein